MVVRNLDTPRKLKHDAIVEAVLEVRFAQEGVPEIFFGRFVDHPHWKSYKPRKLPFPELPQQLLSADPNLRLIPILEAVSDNGQSKLTVGRHAVALFRGRPYPGWEVFGSQIDQFIDSLFETTTNLTVQRIGLKYSNALNSAAHGVHSVSDLALKTTIAADDALEEFNINFINVVSDKSSALVRIATKGFLNGPVPPETTLFVEVDMHTPDGYAETDRGAVKAWIKAAHDDEKREFFHLFKQETIDSWRAA